MINARFKTEERDYFDEHLEEYLRLFCEGRWLAYKLFVERLTRRFMGDRSRLRVLDLGCGPTPAFPILAAHADTYVCADLAERPLRHLAERFRACRCVLADAESLPFADGSFDVVVSFGLLHHLPDPRRAGEEIQRVLATNGIVVASEPSERWSAQTATPGEMASPNERGFSSREVRELFEGMDLVIRTFNHGFVEKVFTRLARPAQRWHRAANAVWSTLFQTERVLDALGLRGDDFLLVGRRRA